MTHFYCCYDHHNTQQPQLSETVTGGLELMVNDYLAKKSTIVLSETSRATKNDLIEMLGLAEKGASWSGKPAVLPHIDGFSWRKGPEDSTENRKAYMAYLEEMLQIPAHYALADVQPNRTLLQVELFRELPETRNISGTTDVVIAKAQHICNQAIRNNIETLLELKEPQNLQQKDHTPQMIGEHIGASYLNRHHAVVSVLTDLNRAWTFCWFARGLGDSDDSNQQMALYRLCLDGGQAAADAKYLLDSLYDKNSVAEDTLPSTFANRLPFQAVLDSFVKNNKRVRREFDRADSSDSADLDSKKPSPFGGGVAGGQHPPTVGTDASGSGTAPENNQGAALSGGGGDAPTMSMASALSLFARPTDRDVANELDLLDMVDDVNEQYEIVRSFAEKHIVPYMRGG
jgi:hypothetical protein